MSIIDVAKRVANSKVRPEDRDEYIYKKNLCVFASEFLLITVLQYVYPSNLENIYLTS